MATPPSDGLQARIRQAIRALAEAQELISLLTQLAGDAGKVQVSIDDQVAGYLADKLVTATPGVGFTVLNPGATEQLRLDIQTASEGLQGLVLLADQPTANAGTDALQAITALRLAQRVLSGGQLGGTIAVPDVRGLRETGGPTLLTLGAVADGQVLQRVGATLVGTNVQTGNSYFFHPAETNNTSGARRVRRVGQNGSFQFNLVAPLGVSPVNIVRNELWGYPIGVGDSLADIDFTSAYGNVAAGEQQNNHTGSDLTQTFDLSVAGRFTTFDVSGALPLLAAGDHGGITVTHNGIGTSVDYLGHYLEWTG